MIKVDKTTVTIPVSCCSTSSVKIDEDKKAESYYSKKNNPKKSYKFEVYKAEDIKDTLEKLFSHKCAYCESVYAHCHPMDVEHYRPKGKIKKEGVDGHIFPGYWWLASDWGNLFPSCIGCNRDRYYLNLNGQRVKLGKGTRFPLQVNTNVYRTVGQEKTEVPLLINPALDDPKLFFNFKVVLSGKKLYSIVEPLNKTGLSELRARTSCECYGLNRPPLVKERTKRIKLLQENLNEVEDLLNIQASLGTNAKLAKQKNQIKKIITRKFKVIKEEYLASDNPYSAACNSLYKSWLRTKNPQLLSKLKVK